MTTINLKDIGGGRVSVYYQDCSSYGNEIFMETVDFDIKESKDILAPGRATIIMEPKHARKLAKLLNEVADECEQENIRMGKIYEESDNF